jgi:hypothetical protein
MARQRGTATASPLGARSLCEDEGDLPLAEPQFSSNAATQCRASAGSMKAKVSAPIPIKRNRKFVDSPLEGDGFELSVPGRAIRPFGRGQDVFQ